MLTDEVIQRLSEISGDEDAALWEQGDILNDNQITRDELKRLATILQQSPANMFNRQHVAAENPTKYRRPEYSWKMYSAFTKIADPTARYSVMFSRTDWTLAEAKGVVKSFMPLPAEEQNKLTHVERAELKVGNVTVKAKLAPNGQFTLHVSLGADRDCVVTPQTVNTKIVFPA